MTEIIKIHAVQKDIKTRNSWVTQSGKLGTVEEIAKEYYLHEREFTGCFIDSACVYGGLLWALFHDILFHDSLNSKQPLCAQFYHTPQRFYERNKDVIEQRLNEYQQNREEILDGKIREFCNHPFFCDPNSKIAKSSGVWLRRNQSELRDFITNSIEHNQEDLIREMIIDSHKGKNAGWPDLVAWSNNSLVFAEVKSQDELSSKQHNWIANHKEKYQIELVRVLSS